jgi:putative FmdB family regulatory protein
MPLYDYACSTHGEFREWRPMSECGLPAPCPECGRPAPRLPAMPSLRQVPSHVRIAHERNERSAEEPRVMTREQLLASHGSIGRQAHRHGSQEGSRNMYRHTMLGHAH